MGGTGIVANKEGGRSEQGFDFGERRGLQVAERAEGGKIVGGAADDDGLKAGLFEVAGELHEVLGGPGFGWVSGEGVDDGNRSLTVAARRAELRGRNFAPGRAEIKHGGS